MRSIRALVITALAFFALAAIFASLPTPVEAHSIAASPYAHTRTLPATLDVPILMYHHVGASFKSLYNVALADFEAQMDYLAKNGYTSVSIDQIAAALRGEASLPECPVAITFDDGYADQYKNALPVLKQHNFKATFNLVTRYVSLSQSFMSWPQVQDLVAGGMWIGAHTLDHSELTQLSDAERKRQIEAPQQILESTLGVSVTTFSYPYGSYNARVIRVVSETGYAASFGIGYGYRQSSDRIYKMNRLAMYNLSMPQFIVFLPKRYPDGTGVCPPRTPSTPTMNRPHSGND